MDKKTSIISKQIARFRGWVQAAATLLTNIHLPNFFKGKIYQGNGKTVCVPGLNCYSCPAASGACPIGAFQAVVGSSKFKFSYYITGFIILLGVILGRIYMRFPLSLRMVPGFAAQDTRQKVLYTKAETTALSEIPDSSGIRNPFANVGHQFDWNGRSLLLQIHMPSGCIGRCHPTFSWQCSYPVGTWQTIYF